MYVELLSLFQVAKTPEASPKQQMFHEAPVYLGSPSVSCVQRFTLNFQVTISNYFFQQHMELLHRHFRYV